MSRWFHTLKFLFLSVQHVYYSATIDNHSREHQRQFVCLISLITDWSKNVFPSRENILFLSQQDLSHRCQLIPILVRTMCFDIHSGSQLGIIILDLSLVFNCDLVQGSKADPVQGVGGAGAPSAMSLQEATVESSSWPARSTRARALILAMYSNYIFYKVFW